MNIFVSARTEHCAAQEQHIPKRDSAQGTALRKVRHVFAHQTLQQFLHVRPPVRLRGLRLFMDNVERVGE